MNAIINWICQDWVQEVAKALFYLVVGADAVLLINDWKRFRAEEAARDDEEAKEHGGKE